MVGTGRCGTVFFAKLLTSLGIPCGHETFFQCDGMEYNLARLENSPDMPSLGVSATARRASENEVWFGKDRKLQADASYMAAPFLDQPYLDKTSIIHVVRNPIKVINSFIGFGYFKPGIHTTVETTNGWVYSEGDYHRFIYENVPELYSEGLTQIDKAALYYVRWNELIEKKSARLRYLFQRSEDDYKELFDFLGVSGEGAYSNKLANAGGAADTITCLDDIPNQDCREQLAEIGSRYGYF